MHDLRATEVKALAIVGAVFLLLIVVGIVLYPVVVQLASMK